MIHIIFHLSVYTWNIYYFFNIFFSDYRQAEEESRRQLGIDLESVPEGVVDNSELAQKGEELFFFIMKIKGCYMTIIHQVLLDLFNYRSLYGFQQCEKLLLKLLKKLTKCERNQMRNATAWFSAKQ